MIPPQPFSFYLFWQIESKFTGFPKGVIPPLLFVGEYEWNPLKLDLRGFKWIFHQ